MREPVTVKLSEPLQAHGEMLQSLTLRAPKGKDLRIAGYPFRMGGDKGQDVVTDPVAVSKLISSLGGIPTSSVDLLEAVDWQACMAAIGGFLGPTGATSSSTDISSRPDGGETPDTSGT
ncbi:MAG: phage tail assembly protein [Janthinobacterium lividum]